MSLLVHAEVCSLFQSFSSNHNLDKNLEITLEMVLDSQLQNAKNVHPLHLKLCSNCLLCFFHSFTNLISTFFFLLLSNPSKFFHETFVTQSNMLKHMKIGRSGKMQLFTIDIMSSRHHYLPHPLLCRCTC